MSSADRKRRWRRRDAEDIGVVPVEYNLTTLECLLHEWGFLEDDADNSRVTLGRGIAKMIDAARVTRSFTPRLVWRNGGYQLELEDSSK
jgi:hypothetical protein